jgi:predicted nucleic acid-binding Zn ribbon protein
MSTNTKEYQSAYRARNKVQLDPVTCAVCGKDFQPVRKSRKTCSDNCRQKLWYDTNRKKRSAIL